MKEFFEFISNRPGVCVDIRYNGLSDRVMFSFMDYIRVLNFEADLLPDEWNEEKAIDVFNKADKYFKNGGKATRKRRSRNG